jgi:hypothetical protein
VSRSCSATAAMVGTPRAVASSRAKPPDRAGRSGDHDCLIGLRVGRRLMSVRHVAAEDFLLQPDERPFDLAFAVRVGALDGRHPGKGVQGRSRIAAALVPGGRLLIDGGNPLREIDLRPNRL